MHTKTLLTAAAAAAAAAATLASAAPVTNAPPPTQNTFQISNFFYGCTVGCDWSFDLTVQGSSPNHPPVSTPVKCTGNLDTNKDYIECGPVSNSDTQSLFAYIVKEDNTLKLKYEVQKPEEGKVFWYTGEREVFAVTSSDAALQEEEFEVAETGVTGAA